MFEFVLVDSSGRALPADRSRIRSKAALDKNKRADSRRSRRDAKRNALLEKEAAIRTRVPAPPPHDFQPIPFAEKIDFESQKLLHTSTQSSLNKLEVRITFKVFAVKISQQGKHPLERSIDFTLWNPAFFEWLQQDKAFLQSVLASAAMADATNSLAKPVSENRTWHHLYRTVTLLNRGLSEKGAHLRDSTLNTVITLCTTSCAVGDRPRADLLQCRCSTKAETTQDTLERLPN